MRGAVHSCYYGKNESALVKMVEKSEPDVVLMAGDIFDDKLKDDNSKAFISAISGRYKCFYVTGNHEFWSGRVDEMKQWLTDNGIAVLNGKCLTDEYRNVYVLKHLRLCIRLCQHQCQ